MAGTINLSLSQQFNTLGAPLAGGRLYFYTAGTTAPQNAYQDSALTLPYPNPIILDAAGRVPPFFLADGQIKIRLTDKNGVAQITADNLVVIGASSGSGTAPTIDPTTVLQTGWVQPIYGFGVISGFVRANARTIGSSTSGATERANADTQNLFTFLWTIDANLVVSSGRGASALADFNANKTIALPDMRGRVLAGMDTMGNTSANVLQSIAGGGVLGAVGGLQTTTITTLNLPPYTPVGSVNNGAIASRIVTDPNVQLIDVGSGGSGDGPGAKARISLVDTTKITISSTQAASSFSGAAQGGSSTAMATIPPTMLISLYIKL